MNRRAKIALAALLAASGTLLATTPSRLDYIPDSVSDFELASVSQEPANGLVPGTEKRLLWFNAEHASTEWSVVALHGFSASRQETAPLAERVAAELGANLFETRFSGHGLERDALVDVRAEDWLDDVAEALRIGQQIGRKIVVLAVSNGAALALSMLDHPLMQGVDSLILLSPNFGPADPNAAWITRPGGPLFLRVVAGKTRSWKAHNELQALYWTTVYPSSALVEVMRVVDRANDRISTTAAPRVQMFYSPDDKVISVPALLAAFETLQSAEKELVLIPEVGEPSAHILAGDIISPDNTLAVAEKITGFVLHRAP